MFHCIYCVLALPARPLFLSSLTCWCTVIGLPHSNFFMWGLTVRVPRKASLFSYCASKSRPDSKQRCQSCSSCFVFNFGNAVCECLLFPHVDKLNLLTKIYAHPPLIRPTSAIVALFVDHGCDLACNSLEKSLIGCWNRFEAVCFTSRSRKDWLADRSDSGQILLKNQ